MTSRQKIISQLLKKDSKFWVIEIHEDLFILYDGKEFKELTNAELTSFRDEKELNPVWSYGTIDYHSNKEKYHLEIQKRYKNPELPLFVDIDSEPDKITEN